MLAFPPWPMEVPSEGCRAAAALRWAPPQRFAPYIARPIVLTRSSPPLQVDDEDSSGSSSPDRDCLEGDLSACEWRGCDSRFASIARLSAHVARAHGLPHHDGLFYCSWRGCMRPQRGFNARYKMLVHVRTHTNERPHTCAQCNKSFSRAENLKIHLRSHSGEKPYVCTYEGCGKAYSNSSDRFKHTRTHTVDKPYCCKVIGCNKRYTDPSSLRKHVKTYKHFTPKITTNEALPDHVYQTNEIRDISPLRDMQESYKPFIVEPRIASSSQVTSLATTYNVPMKETMPPNPIGSPIRYSPLADQVTYINPIDPVMYPLRVPAYEMSYLEYTQMYEHAYRTYYTNSIPLPTPMYDKVYAYEDRPTYKVEERRFEPVNLDKDTDRIDVPLNLKRTDKISCRAESMLVKSMDHSKDYQLVNCMDLPLDLSTKS